jgi:hypothetical protein
MCWIARALLCVYFVVPFVGLSGNDQRVGMLRDAMIEKDLSV